MGLGKGLEGHQGRVTEEATEEEEGSKAPLRALEAGAIRRTPSSLRPA